MNFLSSIKNKFDEYYVKHPLLTGYIVRFVLSILVLFLLRANIGFNEILTNIIFVIVFALVCCFVPTKLMTLALVAYAIVQLFSLSVGIGIVSLLLFMIMYLVYFRFDEKTGYAIVLIPLLCMLRMPFLVPVVLAVSAPIGSVVSVILGFFAYYYLHYIQINTAVFLGATETTEIGKMSMVLQGLFAYREMWYVLAVVLLAFVVTYYLKKININRSSQVAVSIGSGIYLILILLCNLIFDTMSYNKLIWYVASTVVTIIIGVIIADIVLPLDYSRTVMLEFEDEEYKYFVRAVPKAVVTKESVKIKRIYSRKRTDASKNPGAENGNDSNAGGSSGAGSSFSGGFSGSSGSSGAGSSFSGGNSSVGAGTGNYNVDGFYDSSDGFYDSSDGLYNGSDSMGSGNGNGPEADQSLSQDTGRSPFVSSVLEETDEQINDL